MDPVDSAASALRNILDATAGEKVIIFCDNVQREIGDVFANGALSVGMWTKLVVFEPTDEIREEIDLNTKELMVLSKPYVCVNIFRTKPGETPMRGSFVKFEKAQGARIGHCPGITMEMLEDGALALTNRDYKEMFGFGAKLMAKLKGAENIQVISPHGADFSLSVKDREWKVEKTNLPCGEIMCIPPVGDSFTGKLVCTSGGAGRLYRDTPVSITSHEGKAGEATCEDPEVLASVLKDLDRDEGARYLGEFAFGINPKARLVDQFIEAEKVVGTIHVAFGGSEFPTKTHIDLLVEMPTVTVRYSSGNSVEIMKDGKFQLE